MATNPSNNFSTYATIITSFSPSNFANFLICRTTHWHCRYNPNYLEKTSHPLQLNSCIVSQTLSILGCQTKATCSFVGHQVALPPSVSLSIFVGSADREVEVAPEIHGRSIISERCCEAKHQNRSKSLVGINLSNSYKPGPSWTNQSFPFVNHCQPMSTPVGCLRAINTSSGLGPWSGPLQSAPGYLSVVPGTHWQLEALPANLPAEGRAVTVGRSGVGRCNKESDMYGWRKSVDVKIWVDVCLHIHKHIYIYIFIHV